MTAFQILESHLLEKHIIEFFYENCFQKNTGLPKKKIVKVLKTSIRKYFYVLFVQFLYKEFLISHKVINKFYNSMNKFLFITINDSEFLEILFIFVKLKLKAYELLF